MVSNLLNLKRAISVSGHPDTNISTAEPEPVFARIDKREP
jgi:hypothetical protein